MVDDTLRISIGDYSATILLDRLPELPRRNARKILRMLYDPRNQYRMEPSEMDGVLRDRVQTAEAAWREASRQFVNGWKLVDKQKARSKDTLAIRMENRRLKNAVKRAKACRDHWAAVKAINDEIMKGSI